MNSYPEADLRWHRAVSEFFTSLNPSVQLHVDARLLMHFPGQHQRSSQEHVPCKLNICSNAKFIKNDNDKKKNESIFALLS
jgi:hypothetical protein